LNWFIWINVAITIGTYVFIATVLTKEVSQTEDLSNSILFVLTMGYFTAALFMSIY